MRPWSSHEIAGLLELLATALRSLPDKGLRELARARSRSVRSPTGDSSKPGQRKAAKPKQPAKNGQNAGVPKAELQALIKEARLPVKHSSKDSTLKLSRRIQKYLDAHPEAQQRVVALQKGKGSADLTDALRLLRNLDLPAQ